MQIHKHQFTIFATLLCTLALIVSQVQAAQVQLAWDAPTHNTDGSPQTDLAGYTVYYWQPDWELPRRVDILGTQTSHTVTDLEAGQTYRFAVTAFNTSGKESVFSNEVSITIPVTPPAPPGQLKDKFWQNAALVAEYG